MDLLLEKDKPLNLMFEGKQGEIDICWDDGVPVASLYFHDEEDRSDEEFAFINEPESISTAVELKMPHYIHLVSIGNAPLAAFFSQEAAEEYTNGIIAEGDIDSVPLESYRDHAVRVMNHHGKTMPTLEEAQDWIVTEVGEMIDARLQTGGEGKWVRNNPERHGASDIDREIGDVLWMAVLATERNLFEVIEEKWKEKTR